MNKITVRKQLGDVTMRGPGTGPYGSVEYQTLPAASVGLSYLMNMIERMADDVSIPEGSEKDSWMIRVLSEAREAGQVLYPADSQGFLMGLCTLLPRKRWSEAHVADMRIWIDPNYRDQGLGTELFDWAKANAVNRNIARIEAINYETNAQAREWLLGLGFQIEGTLHSAIRTDKYGYIDANIMGVLI